MINTIFAVGKIAIKGAKVVKGIDYTGRVARGITEILILRETIIRNRDNMKKSKY